MNPIPAKTQCWFRSTASLWFRAALLLLPTAIGAHSLAADPAATGSIAGTVSNTATGNLLEGARVELPALGLGTLADYTGRFVLEHVPAGTHQIVASYTGLDSAKFAITVTAGQRVTRDFDLSSGVYKLEAFKVSGEREGLAAAITAQRNADNLKNVASMDQYGNLPNMNATELALRLPGVSFADPGDEVVEQISVRGMGQGTTVITIDGALMSSFSAQSRTTRMTAFNGAMFESLEVVKGQTPDKGADSLGGTVNFKTRSPLSMREKRRINYTLSASQASWFTEQVPLREAHRTHPLFVASYSEKFRAFGSDTENLGVFVNAFYSENAFGFFRTTRDFQQTDATPAYLWDYRTQDDFNNRMQRSLNTKFDYRLSQNSKLTLNLIVNDAPEPMRRRYQTRAFAGSQTTVPSASSGVVPGQFTNRVTVVRAVPTPSSASPTSTPAAAIDVLAELINRNQRLRHGDLSGEHTLGRFDLDWNTTWSRTRYRTLGGEGTLTNRLGGIPFIGPNGSAGSPTNNLKGPNGETGVGWILDRTRSDLYPLFLQNGGLDFTSPNNYRPTVNGLTSNAGDLQQHLVRDAKLNVTAHLPLQAFTASLKAGGEFRTQSVLNTQNRRRWSYLGVNALPNDPSILLWDQVKTHRNIPQWEAAAVVRNGQPTNPALWQEDKYFYESTKYSGANFTKETVNAGYLMTQGRIGNNGFLAGVRTEQTETSSWVYVRNAVATTAAQQTADPAGAAAIDYANNLRRNSGTYTKYFPSAHLWRNFTPNLKGRLSWSTSFARPSMAAYLPTETLSTSVTPNTVTLGNPALRPQMAKNWDATLEYYYEPSGSLSVGWFHKTIKDVIASSVNIGTVADGPNNGFNGQYIGDTLLATENIGNMIAEGFELSYLQQFRFLPGPLKGLSLNANFTMINSHGQFVTSSSTATAYLKNDQIINFIPRTGNISLSWNYRKFGTRLLYNYTSQNIRTTYNVAAPSRNQYMFPRDLVNLGFTYRLRPNTTLQLDIANLFNAPQRYYRGVPDQMQQFLMQGTKITAGLSGQF